MLREKQVLGVYFVLLPAAAWFVLMFLAARRRVGDGALMLHTLGIREFQEKDDGRKSLRLEGYGVYSLEWYEEEGKAWSYA
ncbi:hypothetical protein Pyn_34849 [Prunus yedoensis var. nudiflora]|uniref:Uncharacterized protein n=1 Tax=Prunus yedoensis var. nudiflora TaxID=2094558 RepID=A0A314XWN0_PRUYE|nr:hypothetical protein Pyn_34849 [Prunus yedoensis var. nudiflora]